MQCVSRIRLVLSRPSCLRWSLLCSPKACQALLPPTLTSAVQRKRVESSCATHDQAPLCPIVDPVAKMRDFYGCYLLTSLDPKNKGRTYIGSDILTAAGSVNATQVCINSTMLCRFSPTFFVSSLNPQLVITGLLSTPDGVSVSTMGRSQQVHTEPRGR